MASLRNIMIPVLVAVNQYHSEQLVWNHLTSFLAFTTKGSKYNCTSATFYKIISVSCHCKTTAIQYTLVYCFCLLEPYSSLFQNQMSNFCSFFFKMAALFKNSKNVILYELFLGFAV